MEFHPEFVDKAAVLAVGIARNHPLPDGNKRLAWEALRMFFALNGYDLDFTDEDAIELMLGVAAGEIDDVAVADWLTERLAGPKD